MTHPYIELFPTKLPWVNVPGGQGARMSTIQRGRPMLVEFWDARHEIAYPGAYPLIEHDRHTAGAIALEVGPGLTCYATCFTPGLA